MYHVCECSMYYDISDPFGYLRGKRGCMSAFEYKAGSLSTPFLGKGR